MVFYWSMIGWVLLIYFVYSISHRETVDLREASAEQIVAQRVPWAYVLITFGYIMFWICIRRYIADSLTYIAIFESLPNDYSEATKDLDWSWAGSKGPLFTTFNAFFKSYISENYSWWLTTIAIITGVPIIIKFREYSLDFFVSCYLFVTLGTFFWMMNGMRQFICVGILFGLCNWIKDGKFFRFLIVVVILSFVHLTCLVMIPLYFIARAEPWKTQTFVVIVGMILIAVFAEPFFKGVDDSLGGTIYSNYTEQFSEDNGVNPLRFLFFSIPPVLVLFNRKELSEYYDTYPLLPMCINMSLITAGLYFIGIFTSGILVGRLPIYSEIYDLILMPYIIQLIADRKKSKSLRVLTLLISLLFFSLTFSCHYDSELTGWIE